MTEQAAAPAGDPVAQGAAQATGQDPNSPYLDGIPNDLQPLVREALVRKDADFTRKFQEHSQFRKQWEPYSQIDGLSDVDPEDLQALVQWSQQTNSPESFIGWWQGVAQNLAQNPENAEQVEQAWLTLGEQMGWFDTSDDQGGGGEQEAGGGGYELPPEVAQQLQELSQFKEQFSQYLGSQEQEKLVTQVQQEMEQRLTDLAGEHKLDFEQDPGLRDDIIDLAYAIANSDENEDDPLGKATERILRRSGKAQGDLIDDKLERRNGPALNGGNADTRPPQFSHNDPRLADAVRARFQ